jgi:hypothetical protein
VPDRQDQWDVTEMARALGKLPTTGLAGAVLVRDTLEEEERELNIQNSLKLYKSTIKTAMGYRLAVGYIVELTTTNFNLGDLTYLVGSCNAKLNVLSIKWHKHWAERKDVYIFLGASSKRKSSLPILGVGRLQAVDAKPRDRIRQIRQTRLARVKHF